MLFSRNTTEGFAGRTRKNLGYVKSVFDPHDRQVHVVTHLVNSLLGLVIVPQEWGMDKELKKRTLQTLAGNGKPEWNITLDDPRGNKPKTETLGTLIWHLRNAAAHGRFEFSGDPDSPHLDKVKIIVKDQPYQDAEMNWRAEIRGDHLYEFCLRLADEIETPAG